MFVSALYCLGGYGYNSTSGSPYPPFDTFGNLTLSGWDYLSQYPFGVYSPGARVDEICCSWSPSAGANLVTDGSTFVLSVGGVVSASYPYPSTNESYSYIFSVPTTSCPSGHCTSGSTTYECGAPPSSSATTVGQEGNWTSWILFRNTTIGIETQNANPVPPCPVSFGPGFQFVTSVATDGTTYVAMEGENGGGEMAISASGTVLYCVRLQADLQIAAPSPLVSGSIYGTYSVVGAFYYPPATQQLSVFKNGKQLQNITTSALYSVGMDPSGRWIALLNHYDDYNFTLTIYRAVGTASG